MKITPIKTEYYLNNYPKSSNNKGVSENNKNLFICNKTIVQSTLNQGKPTFGSYLADINLTDCYIKDDFKNTVSGKNKTIVQPTLKEFSNSRGSYLADINLSDCYIKETEDSLNPFASMCIADINIAKKNNIGFKGGIYPQFLIDQDASEQYQTVSEGIDDITNSSYCKDIEISDIFKKLLNSLKEHLPKQN